MSRGLIWLMIGIILLLIIGFNFLELGPFLGIDTHIRQGLDLQGGQQILLEADLPADQAISEQSMEIARKIIENRVNALGLTEPIVQVSGPRRIVVELPGYDKPEEALALIKTTALLEFVESSYPLTKDQIIQTDYLTSTLSGESSTSDGGTLSSPTGTSTNGLTAATATRTAVSSITATPTSESGPIFHTVMTGAMLKSAQVGRNSQTGELIVDFVLTDEGATIFGDYTSKHVKGFLAIVLDKKVISSPQIETPILTGSGMITGNFTTDEANNLAISLSYGALPIPLKPIRSQSVGPTLGQDSLRRSLLAGMIGLSAVALFMLLYYRLPGILADLALCMYALTSIAIYRIVPVTFTLPGIAGFILSVGMAVDANILIFERMKEELRGGRVLRDAVDIGFSRAWSSIRDSNISTLITCGILVWFGSTFGASIVKGFAITLAIGVLVSMFTAIVVTRSLLHLILDRIDFSRRHSWFGIQEDQS